MKTAPMKLAIDGGKPIRSNPLPVRRPFDHREREAVDRLFRSAIQTGGNFDRYGIGPQAAGTSSPPDLDEARSEVDRFESELADFYGVAHVTAVASGTGAIHAALGALDLEPGTEVVTSPLTDPGVVMAILFLGCVPVFVDHDYDTALAGAANLEVGVTEHTGAIIVTHLMGLVCDMDRVMEVGRRRGIAVIADAAQAHGSLFKKSRSLPFGDVGAVSMMSTKQMTSGGQGGFVATNNEDLYWAAKRFADRGKPFGHARVPHDGPHGGDRQSVGLNLRMTELEAVVGRVQLTKLDAAMQARLKILRDLNAGIEALEAVRPVKICDDVDPNPWGALFRLDRTRLSVSVREFAAAMTAEGIAAVPAIPDMIPAVDELSFMRHKKTFGHSHYPYGHELGGRIIHAQEQGHPVVDRLARDLVLVWIHEGWGSQEIEDSLAAFRKVETAFLSGGG